MITCPKCNAPLEDDAIFCNRCGTPVAREQPQPAAPAAAPVFCPNCGQKVDADTEFCPNCGSRVSSGSGNGGDAWRAAEAPPPPPPSEPVYETVFCPNCGERTSTEFAFCQSCGAPIAPEAAGSRPKVKFVLKKWMVFAAAGVVAAAVIILVLSLLLKGGGSGGGSYGLYIKDKEIFYTTFSKSGPTQITSKLVSSSRDVDNSDLASSNYQLNSLLALSSDGKTLFFPDKVDSGGGVSLYYRTLSGKGKDAVKIDSDVTRYAVNEAATTVTYLKSGGTLYQYDMKKGEKEKISSDISQFWVSDDGKTVIYLNSENTAYYKVSGKDKEKIDSDISNVHHVSDDCGMMVYTKDDILYLKKSGKDKEKVASEVYSVRAAYGSGEIYYTKADDTEHSLADYVTDDKKGADEAMQEPDYPSRYNYDDTNAYNNAVAEYNTLYAAYQEKLERDWMRQQLEDYPMSQTNYTLFYYDGSDSSVLTDSYISYNDTLSSDKALMVYRSYSREEFEPLKLSDYTSVYDLNTAVSNALNSSSQVNLAVGGNTFPLATETGTRFTISGDGKKVYYIDDIPDGKSYGDLYLISISNGTPQKAELYDTDVYDGHMLFSGANSLIYFKDVKVYQGELYLDKTHVDDDVFIYQPMYRKDTSELIYYADWNDSKQHGTLKVFQKNKAVSIADDVYTGLITPSGEILYLTDYSMTRYKGDLYLYKNGKAERIDEEVVCLLSIYPTKYKSQGYY